MKNGIILALAFLALIEGAFITHLVLRSRLEGDGENRWILNLKDKEYVIIRTEDEELDVDISNDDGRLTFGIATESGVGLTYNIEDNNQAISTFVSKQEFFKDSDGDGIPEWKFIRDEETGLKAYLLTDYTWEEYDKN